MLSPLSYLKHVRDEFAHVVWPTTRTAVAHTLVVIFIAGLLAVLIGVLDYLFSVVVGVVAGA